MCERPRTHICVHVSRVCGVGRATITGWRPQKVKGGLLLTAVSDGLWEVRKATREELLADQKVRARTVPGNPNPKRKERGDDT